jgi:hypothetical protein
MASRGRECPSGVRATTFILTAVSSFLLCGPSRSGVRRDRFAESSPFSCSQRSAGHPPSLSPRPMVKIVRRS